MQCPICYNEHEEKTLFCKDVRGRCFQTPDEITHRIHRYQRLKQLIVETRVALDESYGILQDLENRGGKNEET